MNPGLPKFRSSIILIAMGIVAGVLFSERTLFAGELTAGQGTSHSDVATDKSGFNLFNPTPTNLLRDMDTDRPDETEGPTTVDAGHIQLEMDFATYTFDRTSGVETNVWNVAPFNIRVGLLNNVEFNLIFDDYVHADINDHPARKSATLDGVGDLTARVKINLWGNDGGQTAFALLPSLKFPTNTGGIGNDSVEGGVLLPLAIKLPNKFDLGLETGAGFIRNDADTGYVAGFTNSITLARDIIGKLGGYVEFFTVVTTERDSGWKGTFDVGLVYHLTENVQLDCGCNIGVTSSAENVHAFSGISVRF